MTSSTSLYSSAGNAGNVASQNFTTLYSGSGSINPTQPYGNANVVGLLSTGTDGGNTIGNISATGNVTAAYFIGDVIGNVIGGYGNSNVADYLPTFGGNILFGNLLMNPNSGNASIGPGTGNTAGIVIKNASDSGIVNTVDVNDLVVSIDSLDPINGGNANVVVDGAFGVYFRTTNSANVQKNWDFTDQGLTVFPGPLRLANGTSLANSVVYSNVDGTPGQVLTTYGNGITYFGDVTATYGNANVVSLLSNLGANSISTTGNVTAANFFGNVTGNVTGNIIGNVIVPGANTQILINDGGNIGTGAGFTFDTAANALAVPGTVSAAGNITGNYFLGNGSQLTGLPATYSNANVVSLMASFGSNSISTTGNVTATAFAGDGSLLSNITGANVSGTVATATSATSAATAATVTGNAQANITSVGTLTSLSVTGNATTGNLLTAGVVSATGNVTGNFFIGNGSQLTGIAASYGNADVVSLLAAFGSNSISTTGNVTASYQIGNGSLLSNITGANVTGTVATATTATTAGTVTGNAQANITSVGTLTSLSVTGNTATGGLLTDNYYYANGTPVSFGGSYSNANVVSLMASFGSNSISTTGNVTTSRGQAGNIITTGSIINTANIWVDTAAALTSPSVIIIGNGYNGNYSSTYLTNSQRNTRLSLLDQLTVTDNGSRKVELASAVYYDLNGNVTYGAANSNSRLQGISSEMFVLNGNSVQSSPNQVRSGVFAVTAGFSANVGNANVATATALQTFLTASNGSRIGNAYGITAQTNANVVQGSAIPTAIMFTAAPNHNPGSGAVDVGNVFNYYTPSNTNTFGINVGNTMRVSNYWNIYNQDNANKNQLGALTQYQESSYSLTSSAGSVVVNKANSQVQYYTVSEAATMSFTGFVTVATIPVGGGVPTAVNRYQTDTVTVIVQQDSTGRTITMPTGAAFKYSGGVSTVPAAANAISMISITAYYNPATSATAYLTTISPAFS